MKNTKKLQRFLSIFLSCVMILNVPMSAMAFDDIQMVYVEDDAEMFAAEEEIFSDDTIVSDDAIVEEELILDSEEETVLEEKVTGTEELSGETALSEEPGIEIVSIEEAIVPEEIAEEAVTVFAETETAAAAGLDISDLAFDVTDPAGYVTISFVDNGVRPENAAIDNAELYGEPVGTIIDAAQVPYVSGDNMADVTVRLLDAMDLDYSCQGSTENGFYLESLNDFELNGTYYPTFGEFDAGKDSGWCVRLNNWHIDSSASAFEVADGDVISWLYTCQLGSDVGVDYTNPSAEITEVKLSDDSKFELVWDENAKQYTCEVPFYTDSIAFEVMLQNYASVITVTVDGRQVNYRPNKAIRVTSASKIVISTELKYMDAENNNEVTIYRDYETIQLTEKPNNAPVVREDAPTELETKERIETSMDFDTLFTDADGDTLSYHVTCEALELDQDLESSVFSGVIPAPGEYSMTITATDGKDSVSHTILVKAAANTAPNLKAAYAETKSATYVYSTSYVYIYMDDLFEDADGDTLTYEATLNGEAVEISYNSWSKQYYIMFSEKPVIKEFKIKAFDGLDYSEEFTAKCIGTSATITAPENSPLIEAGSNYYYVKGTAENDTFALNYTLDTDTDIIPTWTSSNTSVLTLNEDNTFTVNESVTARTQAMIGVTYGKDGWGSPLYLGTKYIYILPAMPQAADITAPLAEHADKQSATVVSNAFTGWYGSEFEYELGDPSICDLEYSGSYGLKVTPKKLGTTAVTATFKYDKSIQCTFNVTVTGLSVQIKDQPDVDSVTFEKNKTVQMEVLGASEGETFTWTSANENVAVINENGLVTLKGLGQTYITAESSLSTEETPVKASMYLQVKESDKVYLDDIAVTDYGYFDGFISAKSAFNSAQLAYDWTIDSERYSYSKLAFTPYFDDETLDAVLHYQVSGGEYQTMELTSGTAVNITNGLNPGDNTVMIDVYPTDNEENITTYTFRIFRPYNPTNTITRMVVYPNGETALAYPTYLDSPEGTIYQIDAATGEFKTGWNGKPTTGWSSSHDTFKTYVFGKRTASVALYPTFGYANERVMIYVDDVQLEEAVTTWKSALIPVDEDGVKITFHVNSEKYHAEKLAEGVEDPFAEPEKVYTLYVENVTPLGIDSKILSAEIIGGEFYKPGFTSSSYSISALIPAGESTADLKFTVADGIDVYKTSVSDANKLTADEKDADGNCVYTTPIVTITGSGTYAYSTTNIILQVTDEDGNIGKTQYAFTVSRRGAKGVFPDSIEEYLCIGSQYTNMSSYGTMPERTLKEGGGVLSLGNFGGYIVYKYDTPIVNDPSNPYGVDFVAYGNSFGNGAHEPGYVQVSQDGKTWYTLAGSEHYDDHNDWGFTMTYTNNNGKSAWTNSDGESGEIYNYPKAAAYPYFTWTEALEQSMTVSGYKLNSSAKDAYGSAAAVLPVFGYVDVNTNGTIDGTAVNPYNHPGALTTGGDQFDLDWAVDANGMPVQLDSISYIRIATASCIYAGAIGEKSTEVTAVTRVTNAAAGAVGETAAPTSIKVNGEEIAVPENSGVLTVNIDPAYLDQGTEEGDYAAVLTVEVAAGEEANVYINNEGTTLRRYASVPDKGIVRIIVQEGEKEPYICYLKLRSVEPAVEAVEALINAIGNVTLDSEKAIADAKAAYEALTEEQKAKVSNYSVLTAAQTQLEKLQEEAQTPDTETPDTETPDTETPDTETPDTEHVHKWDTGTVTKAATCTATGVKTYKCSCGETKTEAIAKTAHSYGEWTTVSEADVLNKEVQKHTCKVCGASETQEVGEVLPWVLELPGKLKSIKMKKGDKENFSVKLAAGDSVTSVKSSKTKYLKASLNKTTGKITLRALKTGTSKLTIKLASGAKKTYTVKVVKGTVKTTSISVSNAKNKTVTVKKGKTFKLKTVLKPFTSTQKVTYKSNKKNIATVSAAGKIKGIKKGTAKITVKSGSKKLTIKVKVK